MTQADWRGLREELVSRARQLLRTGLVHGTSGNLSVRPAGSASFCITPSGLDYEAMRPEDLVEVDMSGHWDGLRPSVDMPVHLALHRSRPDVCAVVHTHSPYAAAFSTLRRPIPALLTEAAGFLGGRVRVLDYVPPARDDTGEAVAAGLGRDRAVLLPHHGVVAVGESLAKAFQAAAIVEESAHVAHLALALGEPEEVPESEVRRMNDFVHHRYGQR